MTKNAYIHIPFCKSKCHYCSFVSFPTLELKAQYLQALISQIKVEYKGEELKTLYLGGGTPSLLTINELKSLIDLFQYENNAEITIEVNPDSVDFEYLRGLKELGINRLSIGSQSFDDKILKQIGRRHNSAQIRSAVKSAKDTGFDNISLDFIYGLPTQTIESFESDLKIAINLGVQHISLYGLKIEEGCTFYKKMPSDLADLDIQADMYLKAIEVCKKSGFEHYEISNFSLPIFNSKHNLNYWDNNTYYGFGCSASGYENAVRYTNETDLGKYIKNPLGKDSEQKLTEQEILEETIFLGLRKTEGINIEEINKQFNIDFNKKYAKTLDKYCDYFIKTPSGWALTIEGILISNDILSEFIGH